MLYILAMTIVVTAVAELGDKTQIVAFGLSTRYRPSLVLLATVLVNAPVVFVFVLFGRWASGLLPEFWQLLLGSAAFLAFGVVTGRPRQEEKPSRPVGHRPLATAMGLLLLSQIGDKAALVTMAVAANPSGPLLALGRAGLFVGGALEGLRASVAAASPVEVFIAIWLGSMLGNVISDGASVVAAAVLGRALPERWVRTVSASVFIALGVVGVVAAWGARATA